MKISAINNQTNFGMLMGKKDVTYYYGKSDNKVTTVQHLYPFKDEFKSAKDVDWALTQFKRSDFFKEQNTPDEKTGDIRTYKLSVEKTLPFTRQEFIRTVKYPNSYMVSKPAEEFIKSKEYNATNIKYTGFMPAKLVNEGQIERII